MYIEIDANNKVLGYSDKPSDNYIKIFRTTYSVM